MFPKNFLWGVATSSYQIEGGAFVDGKGESIWDRFCVNPYKIEDKSTGATACDHYNRIYEDIELMKKMGIKSYRFSIAWTRIFPNGDKKINEQGIVFYKNLISKLREADIKVMATLYHWDLPQKLQEKGGWANEKTIESFLYYAKTIFENFGNDIDYYVTFNEPWVCTFLGNAYGVHAPGLTDFKTAILVLHNIMIAHGKTVKLFREFNLSSKIGATSGLDNYYPDTESDEDKIATKRAFDFVNGTFLEPIFRGKYPEELIEFYNENDLIPDSMKIEDIKQAFEPIDFLGVNYYTSYYVQSQPEDENNWPLNLDYVKKDGKTTALDWEIVPTGLYELLLTIRKEFTDIPIIITENGGAFSDNKRKNEIIQDFDRISYMYKHLEQIEKAIDAGVEVAGYHAWTLFDNFEWAYGYSKKFGLVEVDSQTKNRTMKQSAKWYSKVIAKNDLVEWE